MLGSIIVQILRFVLIAGCVLGMGACGAVQDVTRSAQEAATSAASIKQTADLLAPTFQAGAGSLRQTAEAFAPTLEAQAPGLRQTMEVLGPTLQARAPEVAATLEAFATQQPLDGVAVRQTVESLTGGGPTPADIPLPAQRRDLITTADRLTYTTSDSYGSLLELYQGDMPTMGWEALPDSSVSGGAATLRFRKQNRTATIVIAQMAEGATVDISIAQSKD